MTGRLPLFLNFPVKGMKESRRGVCYQIPLPKSGLNPSFHAFTLEVSKKSLYILVIWCYKDVLNPERVLTLKSGSDNKR